ncbi:uncharacterized protein [Coffea arabica]|uniref:Reverse transcriptase domain-containing protein n=1 Tax=Coffea arabica TaxID=13443 RepID=A0ABM4U0W1_COFAR
MCNHLENEASDHSMLLLDTNPDQRKVKKRFYFDQRWVKNGEIREVIERVWGSEHQGSRMFKVTRKIRECRMALLTWKRNNSLNSGRQIMELKEKIQELKVSNNLEKRGQITELKLQLSTAYREEELYWSHKARTRWLQEGDKNTAFFHASVMAARKQRKITCLQKDNGQWCKTDQELREEILVSFFHTGNMLKVVNETLITLIPKVENPINLTQYRPISLCNTLYKIISKVLANKLKVVLNKCISETQSAFVPSRQIVDNVLIAHEVMHFLKNKRKGKVGFMAIKLDMSKAYDKVEWKFIGRMMVNMGFCPIFVRWIISYISSVSYSFNLNGAKVGYIKPSRGLRQGDPLSPYLFLICAKAPVRWEELRDLQSNLWRWWEAVAQTGSKELGTEHIVLTANILWQIWKARNKMVFEQQRSGANDVVQRAQQEWLEYDDVWQQEGAIKQNERAGSQMEQVMVPRAEGVIRISTDAALNARMIRTGK